MIISADLPDALAAKIDALVQANDPPPPEWPFPKKTVVPEALSAADRKRLEEYQTAFAAYETAQRDGTVPRSRSAVVRKIIVEYFAAK